MMQEDQNVAPQAQEPVSQPQEQVSSEPALTSPGNVRYAGFGVRLIAAIIDGIALAVINGIVSTVISTMTGIGTSVAAEASDEAAFSTLFAGMGISMLFNLIISWGYYVGFLGYKGATPGKMLLGLQVVSEDFNKVSFGVAFLREIIGKALSAMILGLGYLWVLFDEKKQGWHDKIAKTVVVYKDSLPQS